jgi:hypothetical protein
MPSGRRNLPTDAQLTRLSALLRAGNHPDVAAEASGIPLEMLRQLLADGPTMREGSKTFVMFREVAQALAEAEAGHVAVIARAARGDSERGVAPNWQAAAWLLERRYSERWARPSQREKGEDGGVTPASTLDPFAEVDELAARRNGN